MDLLCMCVTSAKKKLEYIPQSPIPEYDIFADK